MTCPLFFIILVPLLPVWVHVTSSSKSAELLNCSNIIWPPECSNNPQTARFQQKDICDRSITRDETLFFLPVTGAGTGTGHMTRPFWLVTLAGNGRG